MIGRGAARRATWTSPSRAARKPPWFTAAALAALAAACASGAYKRAGNADDVAAALARARGPTPAPGSRVFLALEGPGGPRIGAYDLAGKRLLWTQPGEVTTRIEVGAGVIVHGGHAGNGPAPVVFGRDAGSGAVMWQRPIAVTERLYGYAVDGDAVYLAVQTIGVSVAATTGELLALDARTGAARWRRPLPSGRIAAPAARGGLVAVPVESQYVLLYDGASGDELGEVLSTEVAATFVRALPEGLFYGGNGVFLLAPGTARGSRQAPGYLRARLPPFVRPLYWYDGYRREQGEYSAIDRNRVLWRVAVDGDRARFRDDVAIVHDFRFFFAFDAASGALRWAYDHPVTDAVASADNGRAVLFVSADGDIGALDPATGARVYEARLPGATVRGATFDVEGFSPAAAPGPAPNLITSLEDIIADPDQRFPAVKIFGIEELGRQPGRDVTATLLRLLATKGLPPLAYQKAGEALAARHDLDAADLLGAALRAHADYTQDRPAPPVDVLARAVGALGPGGRTLVPDLAAHLFLPETSPAAAEDIVHALSAIGPGAAPASAAALRDFVTLYRADPLYAADPAALVAAAEALLKLGGPADRALLLYVCEEPHTIAGLRAHLAWALGETASGAAATAAPSTTSAAAVAP